MICTTPLSSALLHPASLKETKALCTRIYAKKLPDIVRYPRRTQLPPNPGVDIVIKKKTNTEPSPCEGDLTIDDEDESVDNNDDVVWDDFEIEVISLLFQARIPQKPRRVNRERPLPLPLPHKIRPLGFPTPKTRIRESSPSVVASRAAITKQVYKNPEFLIGLARDIRGLNSEEEVSKVLDDSSRFLRKGSLSLTIRELGRMHLPERALQVFCWAQKQPHLFPDDRVLASTVEVLARNHELKVPFDLEKFISLASRNVMESMVRGFIKGGNLKLAMELLLAAKCNERMLGPSVYVKLILELGKNPDKYTLVMPLLDDLAGRENLDLSQQDCTTIMKICVRLQRFDMVKSLFQWYKESGRDISIVMYTTVLHSRYSEQKYREAMALVWEMEASDCLLNLPAYRVAIRLFVAINDIARATRYYSKLKEAGFSPSYDIYKNLIKMYLDSGRLAKCKEICNEAQMAGFKLDRRFTEQLQLDGNLK